ncbi:MAG: protein kinase [Bradymonadales bacterium]|nr:protein kinase [Bradymonadales bacterium]
MRCSNCGEHNAPGMRFCVACGTALALETGALPHPEEEPSLISPGTVLKATYEVLHPLGEGGAGVVYEGRHIDLGHPVAIKVLFGHLARNPTIRARFIEEGRIQANLRHPNVVQVHDTIEEEGRVAIVMEYIDGESLHTFIHRQRQPVPLLFAIHLALRLLAGLGTAHAAGVVHRDIKPGNILLARVEEGLVPKLCDFGIAKVEAARGRTVTGTKMGTVYYMAPEQFEDARAVDLRADIYAFGVTFYELLTQRLPFESENEFAVIKAHLEVDPPSPRSFRSDLSPDLEQVVRKALAKQPGDRFQSCQQMAQALIALPGFETLKGYVSHPVVLDGLDLPTRGVAEPGPVPRRVSPLGLQSPKGEERSAGQRLASPPTSATLLGPPARKSGETRSVPWFPIFLAVFAVILAASVVLWWSRHQQDSSMSGEKHGTEPTEAVSTSQSAGSLVVEALPGTEGSEHPVLPFDKNDPSVAALGNGEATSEISVQTCLALVEDLAAVLSLTGTGEPETAALLEQAAEPCRQLLLESVGNNRFDLLWAQVHADQLLIARHLLRGHQAVETERRCLQMALAHRAYGRAIDRIRSDLEAEGLLDFEADSMREVGRGLQENQSRLEAHFPECPW